MEGRHGNQFTDVAFTEFASLGDGISHVLKELILLSTLPALIFINRHTNPPPMNILSMENISYFVTIAEAIKNKSEIGRDAGLK
jgi:hypothetical protein